MFAGRLCCAPERRMPPGTTLPRISSRAPWYPGPGPARNASLSGSSYLAPNPWAPKYFTWRPHPRQRPRRGRTAETKSTFIKTLSSLGFPLKYLRKHCPYGNIRRYRGAARNLPPIVPGEFRRRRGHILACQIVRLSKPPPGTRPPPHSYVRKISRRTAGQHKRGRTGTSLKERLDHLDVAHAARRVQGRETAGIASIDDGAALSKVT